MQKACSKYMPMHLLDNHDVLFDNNNNKCGFSACTDNLFIKA